MDCNVVRNCLRRSVSSVCAKREAECRQDGVLLFALTPVTGTASQEVPGPHAKQRKRKSGTPEYGCLDSAFVYEAKRYKSSRRQLGEREWGGSGVGESDRVQSRGQEVRREQEIRKMGEGGEESGENRWSGERQEEGGVQGHRRRASLLQNDGINDEVFLCL